MAISAAMAEKIATAKASSGGNWFKVGQYLLEIGTITCETKHKGDMFIVETEVLESVQTDPKITPNPVGTYVSYVVALGSLSGPGDVKSFIMGLYNVPAEEVTIDVINELCGSKQPAEGLLIRDDVYEKPQRANPAKMFTHHRWTHEEEIPKA